MAGFITIINRVHRNLTRLGWGEDLQLWSIANRKQRKEPVMAEVSVVEEEQKKIKAVS